MSEPAFDPWSATMEEAMALRGEDAGPDAPFFQWVAAHRILDSRRAIERSGFAVLHAVSLCALHRLAMPYWLADEYLRRYRHVAEMRGKSWDDDEAFGRPYRKGLQLAAARRRRRVGLQVWMLVCDFKRRHGESAPLEWLWEQFDGGAGRATAGRAVDTTLAERARKLGVSSDHARDLLKEQVERIGVAWSTSGKVDP